MQSLTNIVGIIAVLFRSVVLTAALCLSSTIVSAQAGQTREGAVRFLMMLAERGDLLADIMQGGDWSPAQIYHLKTGKAYRGAADPRRIIQFEELSGCQFRFTVETKEQHPHPRISEMIITHERIAPMTLDLSEISAISPGKAPDDLIIVGDHDKPIRFQVKNGEMRSRAAHALDFIRRSCDSTANTGF